METVTVEAQPVIEIPEVAATNEIVRYEPTQTAIEPATSDTDIVETTWRVVDDKPQGSPALLEPKPYTLNQQLADEAQANGWLFERPTNELSLGEQMAQAVKTQPAAAPALRSKTALAPASSAPAASSVPASRHRTGLEVPGLLGTTADLGMDGIGRLFDWLFDIFTFGLFRGNAAPRYRPARRILFVTRLDFGETLGAHLVSVGLPLQVEGMEDRKTNMPEYSFSISANHLRWGLHLMRDYGCEVEYDKERELWEVLPT